MSTKTRIVRHTETWQAKLGVSLVGVEGVRLGYCKHGDALYSPANELPAYVVEFLGLRIEPADQMWPYYIDASLKTLADVTAAAGSSFRIIDADESIIEFEVEVEEQFEEPVIVEVDWDNCYDICGGDTPDDDGWVDVVYFDVGEVDDKWYMTATLDTLSYTGDLATDYGPYDSRDDALLAGIDVAFDWFITSDLNPLHLSASMAPELQKIIADNNMQQLFDGRNLRQEDEE